MVTSEVNRTKKTNQAQRHLAPPLRHILYNPHIPSLAEEEIALQRSANGSILDLSRCQFHPDLSDKNTCVCTPLTSSVRDVHAVEGHALPPVQEQRVLQQVQRGERVAAQSGEEEVEEAAHPFPSSSASPRTER